MRPHEETLQPPALGGTFFRKHIANPVCAIEGRVSYFGTKYENIKPTKIVILRGDRTWVFRLLQ